MPAPTADPPRVAVLMDHATGFNRAVLRGVQEFIAGRGHWVVHNAPCEPRVLPALREWAPDGVIAHVTDRETAEGLRAWNGPVVSTTSMLDGLPFTLVDVDHRATGRMAAEHFMERGHTAFAFFGSDQAGTSRMRERGYRERLEQAGHSVRACHAESMPARHRAESWSRTEEQVERWLLELPRPCAIFVANDLPARTVTNACAQLGLRIPEECSILSADNDEFECLFTTPTLSSIDVPGFKIGIMAATAIDALIMGTRPAPEQTTILPPVQIVERQSTDIVATRDKSVRTGISFIRAHYAQQISVDDIADAAECSRRTLERRFRSTLDRTVHEELTRQRLARARRLLLETDLDLETLAHRTGFTDARRLAVVFRQHFGRSPSRFRSELR